MEKIKNAIKSSYQWLSLEGGMLHFLACYAIMHTFEPIGLGWASLITWALAIGKEAFDLIRKSNNLRNVANDIIRDAIGWACAYVVVMLQSL
jgi:hypothetical protein